MSVFVPQITILGAGSMGGAIPSGLFSPKVQTAGITVSNRIEAKAVTVRLEGVVSLALESQPDATAIAVRGAKLVLLGVKPALVPGLLADIRESLGPDALVVSVAAGVTIATMEALVPQVLFRSMPNTPAVVGLGVTGVAAGSRATTDDTAMVRNLFETVVAVIELPESQIDALSFISGSGPAHVFLIEQLTATARRLGFDEAQSRLMVEQTFRGASELLRCRIPTRPNCAAASPARRAPPNAPSACSGERDSARCSTGRPPRYWGGRPRWHGASSA